MSRFRVPWSPLQSPRVPPSPGDIWETGPASRSSLIGAIVRSRGSLHAQDPPRRRYMDDTDVVMAAPEMTKRPASLVIVEVIAWVGATLSSLVYLRFSTNGYWGDDWPLFADAVRGFGPLAPISAHVRPIVRLHFLLYNLSPSPHFVHFLQLLLHVATALLIFFLLKLLYDARTARLAALIFVAAFPANEAV